MHISGEVKPAFEPLRELFQQSLSAARDKNAQLCIYVGEERVVDLWASSGSDDFSADTLVNVFSAGTCETRRGHGQRWPNSGPYRIGSNRSPCFACGTC